MNARLKEKEVQINNLSVRQQSEEDEEKLESFQATRLQLETKEQMAKKLSDKLEQTRQKWAQTLGNEKALQNSLDEQLGKFQKRWSEFTAALDDDDDDNDATKNDTENDGATNNDDDQRPPSLAEQVSQSKQIALLQHKLHQALENVRQAETTRVSLAEALELNQHTQSKLDEMKAKYAAALQQASTNKSRSESASNNATETSSSSRETKESTSDKTNEVVKYEKMHREYKRAREKLAAVTASKETAKAKLERSEKERESLVDTNVRLLRQSTEKDEMNAKSLATILHLKSLTEQLSQERDNLEQQVKSASQLALAARLATNAKERVSEEVVKEKTELEKRLQALETKHAETGEALAKMTRDLSEESGKRTTLSAQLSNALKRSEDLVTECQGKDGRIRELQDSSDNAERESQQAKEKLNAALLQTSTTAVASSSSGASAFTVDQLNTQISVLKGRLACPVCHYRDKECIIMRCRHMHCKQCVDERISNRSRKCPTCNNKFSEKDVEDVWLS